MNLIIDCTLSEPPSDISCFRDVTMYSKIFHFEDVLLSCKTGTKSMYWRWLKNNGAHDYITYVLSEEENETGILMHPNTGDIVIDKITAFNLNYIISQLKLISNNF